MRCRDITFINVIGSTTTQQTLQGNR